MVPKLLLTTKVSAQIRRWIIFGNKCMTSISATSNLCQRKVFYIDSASLSALKKNSSSYRTIFRSLLKLLKMKSKIRVMNKMNKLTGSKVRAITDCIIFFKKTFTRKVLYEFTQIQPTFQNQIKLKNFYFINKQYLKNIPKQVMLTNSNQSLETMSTSTDQ